MMNYYGNAVGASCPANYDNINNNSASSAAAQSQNTTSKHNNNLLNLNSNNINSNNNNHTNNNNHNNHNNNSKNNSAFPQMNETNESNNLKSSEGECSGKRYIDGTSKYTEPTSTTACPQKPTIDELLTLNMDGLHAVWEKLPDGHGIKWNKNRGKALLLLQIVDYLHPPEKSCVKRIYLISNKQRNVGVITDMHGRVTSVDADSPLSNPQKCYLHVNPGDTIVEVNGTTQWSTIMFTRYWKATQCFVLGIIRNGAIIKPNQPLLLQQPSFRPPAPSTSFTKAASESRRLTVTAEEQATAGTRSLSPSALATTSSSSSMDELLQLSSSSSSSSLDAMTMAFIQRSNSRCMQSRPAGIYGEGGQSSQSTIAQLSIQPSNHVNKSEAGVASTATKENVQNTKNHAIQLPSNSIPPPALRHSGLGGGTLRYGQSPPTFRSIAANSSTLGSSGEHSSGTGSGNNSSHLSTSSDQSLFDRVMTEVRAILNDEEFYKKEKERYAEHFMGIVVSLIIQCYEKLSNEYGLCEDRQQLEADRKAVTDMLNSSNALKSAWLQRGYAIDPKLDDDILVAEEKLKSINEKLQRLGRSNGKEKLLKEKIKDLCEKDFEEKKEVMGVEVPNARQTLDLFWAKCAGHDNNNE